MQMILNNTFFWGAESEFQLIERKLRKMLRFSFSPIETYALLEKMIQSSLN